MGHQIVIHVVSKAEGLSVGPWNLTNQSVLKGPCLVPSTITMPHCGRWGVLPILIA